MTRFHVPSPAAGASSAVSRDLGADVQAITIWATPHRHAQPDPRPLLVMAWATARHRPPRPSHTPSQPDRTHAGAESDRHRAASTAGPRPDPVPVNRPHISSRRRALVTLHCAGCCREHGLHCATPSRDNGAIPRQATVRRADLRTRLSLREASRSGPAQGGPRRCRSASVQEGRTRPGSASGAVTGVRSRPSIWHQRSEAC